MDNERKLDPAMSQGDEGIFYCKAFMVKLIMIILQNKVPANLVPAAAVIREGQVLFILTGRKGCVGGDVRQM